MKNFLRISILFTVFLLIFNTTKAESEVYSDTVTQNIKLENPSVYIYGKMTKGTNIKYKNGLLYRLLDNKTFHPKSLNSYFIEKKLLISSPVISFYSGILYDKTPSEAFGLLIQTDINSMTPYADIAWSRTGYKWNGNYFKLPELKFKAGVQPGLSYINDINFRYYYSDFSFYNGTKNQILSLSLSNDWIFSSFEKFNNNLSFAAKGKYIYKKDNFNYGLIYEGFIDTLNRFAKFGIDTRLPKIINNVLTVGFALYPFTSFTPHIFANLSMHYDNFGYELNYSMDKGLLSASALYNENEFINSPRSFVVNRKHHINAMVYSDLNNLSLQLTGEYFKADSLLIPVYTTSYLSAIINNVQYYKLALVSLYTFPSMNVGTSVSYSGMNSNQYPFEPDHYPLNLNFFLKLKIVCSTIMKTKFSIGLFNKNSAGLPYPNAYGLDIGITKSVNKNIHLDFSANNLLNSFYDFNNIVPYKGRNFKLSLIFKI